MLIEIVNTVLGIAAGLFAARWYLLSLENKALRAEIDRLHDMLGGNCEDQKQEPTPLETKNNCRTMWGD